MSEQNKKYQVKLFENFKVRTLWDDKKEDWWFSVVDIVAILTDSPEPRKYWSVLKTRLKKEGSELTTICSQLKMQSPDGKFYKTDVLDTEGILRLVQSVPSPKAEPFKLWLAKVGSERIDEMHDPEKAINRAMQYYLNKGYSVDWINQRLKSIEVRKDLTDEWDRVGVKGTEYGLLTDIITLEWSGMNTREYKNHKGLKKESLRDNMTNIELVLNMLAEASTTEISKKRNPKTMKENKEIAKKGGKIAGDARKQLEIESGKPVISSDNYLHNSKKVKKINAKDK